MSAKTVGVSKWLYKLDQHLYATGARYKTDEGKIRGE